MRLWRVPDLGDSPHAALAVAVGKALAEGPVDDLDELRRERTAILAHLEAPEAERFAAKDFVPRFRAFTQNEVYALHTDEAHWLDSLPDYTVDQRQRVRTRLQGYVNEFTKERKNMERDGLFKSMLLGDITREMFVEINDKFSIEEVLALKNPELELPDSLPRTPAASRKEIAETLRRARETPTGVGSAGEDVRSTQLRIDPQYRDQALQLACAITDRVKAASRVHQLPLQAHISQLLKRVSRSDEFASEQVEQIAREIAVERATLESRMNFARELVAKERKRCEDHTAIRV